MTLPIDIAGIRHTWTRLSSHAWTEQPLRATLVAFLDLFLSTHSWIKNMKLEERFTDTGINVKKPIRGEQSNFLQRDGVPIIKITAVRERDNREFEVAIPFALGNETPPETIGTLIRQAAITIEISEAETHGN